MRIGFRTRGVIAAVVGAVVIAGCGSSTPAATSSSTTSAAGSSSSAPTSSEMSSSASTSAETSSSSAPTATGTITVFAAASLKNTFTAIGETFKTENPGSDVTFSFAGSSDLVTQITGGAPADVFASADTNNMKKITDAGLATDPANFATNTLIIVTPPDNPAGITSFADLAKSGVSVVICADGVPCGTATKKVETATGVTLTPVSEEQSVTDVLNKVTTGEADAGVVYVTDATSAGAKVKAIPFAESSNAVNTYPIVVLKDAANPELAAAFEALVTGTEGQKILADAGFAPAP